MLPKMINPLPALAIAVGLSLPVSATVASEHLDMHAGVEATDAAQSVDTSRFDAEPPYTLGLSNISVGNSFRVQMIEEARYEAERQDAVGELIVTDAGGQANKQISDVEDLLAQDIDALLITPASPSALAPIVERAHDKGIPVIVFSTDVKTDRYTSRILADDHHFGEVGGQFLADALDGEGKIIGLRGIAGLSAEQARWDGAISVIDQHDGMEMVDSVYADWAYDKARQACESLALAHPDIDGVWSSGGAMTRACIEVFQELGRDLVPMTGEAQNGFLRVWKETELESIAPIYPTWIAAEAVVAGVRALEGMPLKSDYMIRPDPITSDEIDEYYEPELGDSYWLGSILPRERLEEMYGK